MIAKETIDKVFEYARVEEVISDFIALKKTGANFKGLSPFTNEKTPSFIVSPSKQIWKDFSSGKGGNVIAFLMEHEQFNYPESIRYLANKYNIAPSTFANAFVNDRPFVTSNIIGATTIDQLKENIDSIDIKFSDEILREIEDIHLADPNPCV